VIIHSMGPKSRVASFATLKSKKMRKEADSNSTILLARGLSARYCGANIPLTSLTTEEMERDLRHMEAFSNACVAYSQQLYIYQNSIAVETDKNNQQAAPMVAMPVRIDPEEEKRLSMLRQKIQQSEVQREALESQYLSLRAHYVYLSQRLKNLRQSVTQRVEFLQDLVKKRGQLLALQRAKLQISREVLACLHYRQSGGKPQADNDKDDGDDAPAVDIVDVWNQIDAQFKQAEEACRASGIEQWQALKIPKIPRGVPLLLSTLAKAPGFTAAWSTSGMFGSNDESLGWLEPEFPEPAHRIKSIVALREEVDLLQRELEKERLLNRDLQTTIIQRCRANNELVAMTALLRTETETVVARHNILLESEVAKEAAHNLHEKEEEVNEGNENVASTETLEVVDSTVEAKSTGDEENDGDDEGAAEEEEEDGEMLEGGAEKRSLEGSGSDGTARSKRRRL
jgi:hypothetical protein